MPSVDRTDLSITSAPMIISLVLLAMFAMTGLGCFVLMFMSIKVDPLMAGILGSILGSTSLGSVAVSAFWLGSNAGAKVAQDNIVAIATAAVASTPLEKPK